MATELPEGLTQVQLDRYAKLDRAIKKYSEEHKTLNEHIKTCATAAKITGTKIWGAVVVKLGSSSSFDKVAFEAKYPVEKFPQYYKMTLDPTSIDAPTKAKFTSKHATLSVSIAD